MKKNVFAGLAIGLFISGVFCSSNAQALTIYWDLASFNAAAGVTTVYGFEADTVGVTCNSNGTYYQTNSAAMIKPASYSSNSNAYRDFGDFAIDATSSGIYMAGVGEEQSGNNNIYVNTSSNTALLDVIFDMDVSAFGFNWSAEGNNSYDHSTFSLLGTTWDLGTPGASGFFGVVETEGTIVGGTPFSFGQSSRNWSSVAFDNITYSSSSPVPSPVPAPVPEPATMLLFGTGLAGLISTKVKRKKK